MTQLSLTYHAVDEATPGPKWAARWQRSWPDYKAWFIANGGDDGPDKAACRAAMKRHMPELIPVYDQLVEITGGSDRAARFLSTWCPPAYLGGCSIAAVASKKHVRLVRNYDLSPKLNEGLFLRSEWSGRAVMGMVEFLWGLSDGINDAGLSIALAFGGRAQTAQGFGVTTIMRYVLETCDTVADALKVLNRVPSHMAYNVVLADATGATASVELSPGGGARLMSAAIATNHQSGPTRADRPAFTRSFERHRHLADLRIKPRKLNRQFLKSPLIQDRYTLGFGTLFTAEYDPKAGAVGLTMRGARWDLSLDGFREGERVVDYGDASKIAPYVAAPSAPGANPAQAAQVDWTRAAQVNWQRVGQDYAAGRGRPIHLYLAEVTA